MSASENGWQPAKASPDQCEWITVPGTTVSLQVLKGVPSTIMRAYAADYNAYVEALRDPDSASWTPTNSVATSNHLNGTAMDLNWNSHPFQVDYAGYTPQMVATMRQLLDFYEGWMFWAQDWDTPKDAMHHQMGYDTYGKDASDFINRKIRPDGFSVFRRGGGGYVPTDNAATVLYDAVPVIDEARAAQLVDAVTAGLVAAQCTNPRRIAMFLAQTGHESDGYNTTVEYGTGQRYAPYIGRTWIQITWQANYSAFGRWAAEEGLIDDPDYFVNNPAALADLKWAGLGAAWYWTVARPTINSLADNGDVVAVTQLINGGQNGITDRRNRYQQAIALGDRLLALLPTKQGDDVDPDLFAADSDDKQNEILAQTRGRWGRLGGRTLIEALGVLVDKATGEDNSQRTDFSW